MVHVVAGTDLYGRVKNVGGTSVVTKFVMIQHFPAYPQRSLYASAESERQKTEKLFEFDSSLDFGIALARLDWASVGMAYMRAIFATIVLFGSIGGFFLGVMYLNNNPPRGPESGFFFIGTLALLGIGITGGILTYSLPLVSRRERYIRQQCGRVLGAFIDPAKLPLESATGIEGFVNTISPIPENEDANRLQLTRIQLVLARVQIARGSDAHVHQNRTDELLEQLIGS